uniref:Protein kinase domain-containing protein n=1 Tax=Kalanchoe fedtschenkoi TaxID=63787 RepID=A0A7N0UHK4_KALFE
MEFRNQTTTTDPASQEFTGYGNYPPRVDQHNDGNLPSTSIIVIIIIAIITILIVLALLLIVLILQRIKSTRANDSSSNESNEHNIGDCKFIPQTAINFNCGSDVNGGYAYGGNLACTPTKFRGVQVFTYRELEVATEGFSEENVIGNAVFGKVYRGVLSDGTVTAIKVLQREGKQVERAFRIEVDLMSRLQSPYFVELLGYCADQNHRHLLFEYMPNGTLQDHLHPNQSHNQYYQPLDWGTRLRIALDCATALEFLHEHAVPAVIHRDFKCSNILLDQNFRAKLSEFGLAKTVSDKINGQISTRVLGTTGYLAPEYASTGKLTTKSDVYSFGVVLLELLTGRVPVDSSRPPGEHVLVSWALPRLTNREKVAEMVDPILEGQYPKKDLIQVAAIAAVCVQSEADYRPLMTDVVQSLIPLTKTNLSTRYSGSYRYPSQSASPR